MSFMQKQIIRGCYSVQFSNSDSAVYPADLGPTKPGSQCIYAESRSFVTECELLTDKFIGRLSASGYLDATEWTGPYDSRDECAAALESMYGDD